jgi:hypothetical protein
MDDYRGLLAAAAGAAVVILYAWFLRRAAAQAKLNAPKPAVVECPDCKGKVSTQIKTCPHCGRPMG